jgi:type IV pilus assembly protein PilQ
MSSSMKTLFWGSIRTWRMVLLCVVALTLLATAARAEDPARAATDMRLVHDEQASHTDILVDFTKPPTFSARMDRKRGRLIVDVPKSAVSGAPPALVETQGFVGGAMIQQFGAGEAATTRIIITVTEDVEYSAAVEGNQLRVRLGKSLSSTTAKSASATPSAAPSSEPAVADVSYDRHGSEDRIRIELSAPASYKQRRISDTLTRLQLQKVVLPEELERSLDVRAYAGVVELISTYGQGPGDVWIDVEHAAGANGRVEHTGNALRWTFFDGAVPSSISGVGLDGKAARQTRTIAQDAPLDEEGAEPVSAAQLHEFSADQAAGFAPAVLAQTAGRYSGRRIDLDFKDADIHNVLRLLADTGRVNIVAADNVQGNVTLRMRNVPWDQALEVVLRAKSLGLERRGNIIRVAPLSELEKERELAIARQKQELQLAPLETRLIPVSYASAGDMMIRSRDLLSERGMVSVDDRTNVMIIRDVSGNLDQIEELVRSLDTQTPQVLIEARIVEATSRYFRDVGIQWGGDASFSAATGNPTGLAFPSSVGIAGGATDGNAPTAGLSPFSNAVANPNYAVNLPAAVGTGAGGSVGFTFGSVDSNFNLALRLSAAETSGMLRILSSPRVLTLDNTEARISQGTLIPFSQVSAQGVQTTFQEAKLQLLVNPHVTADGSVSMRVRINRDEPDFNQTSARGDPTILKREAETELLVMDGHTAVIGGIFTRNTGRNVDQVPFFGEIPLLGLLFQHRSASDTRGELVIFLTPRIVNRAQALGR